MSEVRRLLTYVRFVAVAYVFLLLLFCPYTALPRREEIVLAVLVTLYSIGHTFIASRLGESRRAAPFLIGADVAVCVLLFSLDCALIIRYFLYALLPIMAVCQAYGQRAGYIAAAVMSLFYTLAALHRYVTFGALVEAKQFPVYLTAIFSYYAAAIIFSHWLALLERLREEKAQIETMNRELTSLHGEVEKMAELRERHRLAREVHDRVSSRLFGLALRLETMLPQAEEAAAAGLEEIGRGILESQQALKACLASLETGEGPGINLAEMLKELINYFRREFGLPVEARLDCADVGLPDSVVREIRFIVSEGLMNVLKHARATSVTVSAEKDEGALIIRIADNGVGLGREGNASQGMGQRIMRERAAELGAELHIQPGTDRGTVVTLRLPLSKLLGWECGNDDPGVRG